MTKYVSLLGNYLSYQAKIFLVNLTPKKLAPCKIAHTFRCAFKELVIYLLFAIVIFIIIVIIITTASTIVPLLIGKKTLKPNLFVI